jgi:hypothetical protein
VNQKMLLLVFMGMALLALLVAALIPDIEAQDERVFWQPESLSTATATTTPTEGWYDDLPTPSYGTATLSATPDLTPTQTTTPGTSGLATPTFSITDILITLTAESER